MAFKVFDNTTLATDTPVVSGVIRTSLRNATHTVSATFADSGTTKITALTLLLRGSLTRITTCPNTSVGIAIGSTEQNIKTGTFSYSIDGVGYNKATVAAGTVVYDLVSGSAITATITDTKYGAYAFYINAAGTVRAKVPSAINGVMAYNTPALAHAALDALVTPPGWCYIGRVIVLCATAFTTGTTAFTTVSTYYDAPLPWATLATYPLDATDLAAHSATFHVLDKPVGYVRIMVSAVTGAGSITARYETGAR